MTEKKTLSIKKPLTEKILGKLGGVKPASVFTPQKEQPSTAQAYVAPEIQQPAMKKTQEKCPLTENELIQIRQKEEYINRAFNILKEKFSSTFALDPAKPIQAYRDSVYELLKGELSKTVIGRALKKHTRSEEYHKAVLTSDKRYDIEGNVIGTITPVEKAYAKAALERIEKRKQRNSPITDAPQIKATDDS